MSGILQVLAGPNPNLSTGSTFWTQRVYVYGPVASAGVSQRLVPRVALFSSSPAFNVRPLKSIYGYTGTYCPRERF
ncbi:hypothetical protein FPOAC1_000855 [Fusarium poae]|uniref:hypothetical protein n=1 Tax=Fusarium poae TaxID=36050 RepID=UPI001CEAC08B|nr:hypothetical protein FPOAC1_000855 [Fusarium poae]KAG8674881.1 hypothetical protein FPOAC1_000855 [Fusarium poae]